MIYSYSARNRLLEPHHYMYTPFEGAALLDAFFDARSHMLRSVASGTPRDDADAVTIVRAQAVIDRQLAQHAPGMHAHWRTLLGVARAAPDEGQKNAHVPGGDGLGRFSPDEEVSTSALLAELVAAMSNGVAAEQARVWLDRLTQRFEVSKRLYETYPPGFRKGTGDFRSLRRYWMLALALCLSLARNRNLRLLNTLLKLCDLLCSVAVDDLHKAVPESGMRIVLAMEAVSVRALMSDKGLNGAAV